MSEPDASVDRRDGTEARAALVARLAGLATVAVAGLPVWLRLRNGPATDPGSWANVGLLVSFGVIFWWSSCEIERPRALLLPLLAAASVLSISYAVRDGSGLAGILFVLVASLLVGPVSTPTAITWLVVQNLIYGVLIAARGDLGPRWVPLLAFIGFQVFAFYTSWVAHRERQGRLTLARLHAELEVAHHLLEQGSRERERLRIARDLHDVLGHHLTALALQLEAAHHTTDATRGRHLEASRATVKDLLGEVRTVVSELRQLPGIDLRPALESLVEGFAPAARLAGAQIHLDLPAQLPAVDGERAHLLVRAVQELLTNAARHARAKSVTVALAPAERVVELVVNDDGRGARDPMLGHGLRGLQERVEAAGGSLELESPPRGGFEARLRLPIGGDA